MLCCDNFLLAPGVSNIKHETVFMLFMNLKENIFFDSQYHLRGKKQSLQKKKDIQKQKKTKHL